MCAVAVRHQADLGGVVGVNVDGVNDRVHELLHDVKVLLSHAAGRVEDEHNIRVAGASCEMEQTVITLGGSTCIITVSGATMFHIISAWSIS